jgi:hypothetical protein
MHDLIDMGNGAGVRLGLLPVLSQFRGPKVGWPVWAGAALASTLDGDCGSCAQLIIDQSIEIGVSPNELEQCAKGQADPKSCVGLGFLFAQAAISGASDVDELRAEILDLYGEHTLAAVSFAAACGRIYPVLKRAVGQNSSCEILRFNRIEQVT